MFLTLAGIFMLLRLLQLSNASLPILSRPLFITISLRFSIPWKAPSSIVFILDGRHILFASEVLPRQPTEVTGFPSTFSGIEIISALIVK